MRRQIWVMMIAMLGFTSIPLTTTVEAAAPATLTYGSTANDVPDLQYRLKSLGIFKERVTGYYGTVTTKAVETFQAKSGLRVDGIAGPGTWSVLKKKSVNKYEMDQLAKIIHSEARGEPHKGQVAVGAVVMNRLASPLFPKSVSGVIFQPWAFTAVHDGQYKLIPDNDAYLAAMDAVRGWDPTYNALYYFNPETATSKWIWSRKQTVKIGRHIFAV
ncbi:spore cortex-lytic protein [Paenibacillus swuensis]|uniref:Spore cortex-lytic protein n=1 Tax=Paenibacillus swuensis TaxID=1178515 RepID=A0A172TKY3_9BACL|nr:cell wall hydrolase [Paenibacillus swuensis]ANE47636.1 spore cortex-lytic protein [Paenibacillus swuensis]